MGKGRATAIAVLLLTVPVVTVIASANDPGPGDDAPDTFPEAYTVDGEGTYSGTLTPNGDADWLSLTRSELSIDEDVACMHVVTSGEDALASVQTSLLAAGNQTVTGELNPDYEPAIGLADTDLGETVVGLSPLKSDQSTGNWTVSFETITLTDLDGDAGTGSQAPALEASEEPFAVPGACFGGALKSGETSDAYQLEATTSHRLALSAIGVQGTELNLTAYGPDGEPAVTLPADAGGPVEVVDVEDAGTWTLEVSGPGDLDTSYFVGASLLYDGDTKCRPYCDLLE